ncbi:hypothetical protein [Litchfieldia alkalitelluris]|uniref:hypothetical protein n=1 Tax=Litchfieldia alkalitelluris TaxID=304268 RepID=UPI000997195C|nr:hypothetical protein [Litchfieldia alkalitelluris]
MDIDRKLNNLRQSMDNTVLKKADLTVHQKQQIFKIAVTNNQNKSKHIFTPLLSYMVSLGLIIMLGAYVYFAINESYITKGNQDPNNEGVIEGNGQHEETTAQATDMKSLRKNPTTVLETWLEAMTTYDKQLEYEMYSSDYRSALNNSDEENRAWTLDFRFSGSRMISEQLRTKEKAIYGVKYDSIAAPITFYLETNNDQWYITKIEEAGKQLEKDVRETVWNQLTDKDRERIKGTWKDAKISKVTLTKDMVLQNIDHSYIGKEVYLVDFPTNNTWVPNNMIVYADIESWQYIGHGMVD